MKKIIDARIVEHQKITNDVFSIRLYAKGQFINTKCGQFINVYIDDKSLLLPRPISIADANDDEIRLIIKTVGKGTKLLNMLTIANTIRVSSPLGNGYDISNVRKNDTVILVGGGIGIPPLIYLAKELLKIGAKVVCILGYREELFLNDELSNIGVDIHICTDNGIHGYKGNVVDYLKIHNYNADYYFACGPKPMLNSLAKYLHSINKYVNVSMEERMGCGYGACVGCVVDIYNNNIIKKAKVCKDGPVFDSRMVVWDE